MSNLTQEQMDILEEERQPPQDDDLKAEWFEDHRTDLEDKYIQARDQDFTHWCLMSGKDHTDIDSNIEYIQANIDDFNEFCEEQLQNEP